jgi:hypothetical protein
MLWLPCVLCIQLGSIWRLHRIKAAPLHAERAGLTAGNMVHLLEIGIAGRRASTRGRERRRLKIKQWHRAQSAGEYGTFARSRRRLPSPARRCRDS